MTLSIGALTFIQDLLQDLRAETADDCVRLGLLYYEGKRLAQNYDAAMKWFLAAHKKNSIDALTFIGVCKLRGQGTVQTAAKAKDPLGMLYFSRCLRFGIGTEADVVRANKWLERAAVSNHTAQFEVAEAAYGAKEYAKAVEFYKMAALQGSIKSMYYLGCLLRDGMGVPSPDPIGSHQCFEAAARRRYPPAMNNLGYMYQHGKTKTGADPRLAVYWYEEGAKFSYAPAIHNLGCMYQLGFGVGKDLTKAMELFLQAANLGLAASQHHLGRCYQAGEGVDRDMEKAVYWYEKSLGAAASQNAMGFLYEKGLGVSKNPAKACELYLQAAEQGDVAAQFNLADLYHNGAVGVA
ncbi:hypothetical protein HDU91_003137, partial [Kappamyces sp. JEL0680]